MPNHQNLLKNAIIHYTDLNIMIVLNSVDSITAHYTIEYYKREKC